MDQGYGSAHTRGETGPAAARASTVAIHVLDVGDPVPADHDPAEPTAAGAAPGAEASRVEQAWQRLAKADEIVQGFGERGWITPEAMAEVDRRTGEVARRVGREEQAEGSGDTAALVRDVRELTALLVSLADEAIARQPSLAPETPVPVSLEDAHERLSSTQAAYGDID